MELVLSDPAIYTIRGPRQAGKTTALKLMVERSLREAPDEGVLYYSCDLDNDPDAIREVVQTAKRIRPSVRRWRIFLDEVTTIAGWERGVKWLWDNTDAAKDTFVVTGSSAIDLASGADRLPGRRGDAARPDRILLPLSFSDFARLHGLSPVLEVRPQQLLDTKVQDHLQELLIHLTTLQGLLERYLRCGGFPAAIADEHVSGQVSEITVRMLWDLIENEVQRQRMDATRAFRTIEHTVRALRYPTEWTALGGHLGADRRTAEDYVRLLAYMFTTLILHRLAPERLSPMLRAQRKLYLVDPLLTHLPRQIRQSEIVPDLPALVENIVITALFRSEERPLVEEFAVPQALFYWKSKSGGEVDAIAGAGPMRTRTAVEVKYQATISGREIAALTRSFPRGVVVTREALDVSDRRYPRVPAALFLWVLSGESTVAVAG